MYRNGSYVVTFIDCVTPSHVETLLSVKSVDNFSRKVAKSAAVNTYVIYPLVADGLTTLTAIHPDAHDTISLGFRTTLSVLYVERAGYILSSSQPSDSALDLVT